MCVLVRKTVGTIARLGGRLIFEIGVGIFQKWWYFVRLVIVAIDALPRLCEGTWCGGDGTLAHRCKVFSDHRLGLRVGGCNVLRPKMDAVLCVRRKVSSSLFPSMWFGTWWRPDCVGQSTPTTFCFASPTYCLNGRSKRPMVSGFAS